MGKRTRWADMSEDERAAVKAKREGEITRLKELLVEGAKKAATKPGYIEWMDTAMEFYNYSSRNQLLILAQTGGKATLVASFKQWQKYGRKVRKGEKAIRILAPMNIRYWEDQNGERYGARDDHPDDAKEVSFMRFKAVPVFDIAQTEGEPLEVVRRRVYQERGGGWPLIGSCDDSGAYSLLRALADRYGIKVVETMILGRTRGRTGKGAHIVDGEARDVIDMQIDSHMSLADKAATLAHEIGHYMCGHVGARSQIRRETAELEAESVAYIITGLLGLETGETSFSYVGSWSDYDGKKIADVQDTVVDAVRQIMDDLAQVGDAGVMAA